MKKGDSNNMIILFDGVCNMCVWSIQFIISRDTKDVFRFASMQSLEGQKILQKYSLDINSIILIHNGNVKHGSSAVLHILYHLNTIWKFLIIFYIIPYPIRDLLYAMIAKTRYIIFGKRDKCIVPDASINSKFLSL
jgi:predicted DCC family thiol-disulfide oxidoreductase YuxK